jgi:hypothetical protein
VRSTSDARSGTDFASAVADLARRRAVRLERATAFLPGGPHVLVPLALLGLWGVSISGVDPRDMTDLGLVSVMPVVSLLLVLALSVSFSVALARNANSSWVVLSHVLVLIVMLYGITAFVESEPRFESFWKHAGVIDYIQRHGSVDPGIDAYFNWPGFFVLGAVVTKAAGFSSAVAFGGWSPLVFNLLFLPPLLVIFRSATDDPRLVWLSVWIFFSANWVGQDYVSPQAIAYLIWLSMAAIVLTGIVRAPGVAGTALQRGGFVVVLVVMFTAITAGHQLTPFTALLTLGAFAIFTRLVTGSLVWLTTIILFAWVAYMTTTYLAGHIGTLTHPLGSLGSNVDQNVGNRLRGSPDHTLIAQVRIFVSGGIWLLALAGFLRARDRFRTAGPMVVLAATPFILPILQPYGGEIMLRVFLFALPGVAFFVARLAFPSLSSGRGWSVTAGLAAVTCLLLIAFQYTRYGNERLDFYTKGDVSAVSALYELAPQGSLLVAGSYNLPWRNRDYVSYSYRTLPDLSAWKRNPNATRSVLRQIRSQAGDRPAYVIVTRSTRIGSEMLFGARRSLSKFVATLRRSRAARELYHAGGARIFVVKGERM